MFVLRTFRNITLRRSRSMRVAGVVAVLALVAVVTAFDFDEPGAVASAQVLPFALNPNAVPDGPTIDELTLDPIGEFVAPVEVLSRPGDDRTFVVGLMGTITATDTKTPESVETILDLSELTVVEGERGLLGAAFHPREAFLYVHYSDLDGDSIIAEYAIDPETAIADPESARQVLVVEQPYDNHNGGEVTFGPDGYLYAGFGDGGLADDPIRSALDLSSRLGKILRIDPLATDDAAFSIPSDNPFIDVEGADPTIWSYGLRNPWRFSFDPKSGDLWIADVGQNMWEEINFAPALSDGIGAGGGLSFGWSAYEGDARFNEDQEEDGHTEPFATYERAEGLCSISGGAVYRGDAIPALEGWYVYGDYCTGQVFGFDITQGDDNREVVELAKTEALVAIAAGADGELYAVSVGGVVSRLG